MYQVSIHRAADCVSRHPTGSADKLALQDDIAAIDQCTVKLGYSELGYSEYSVTAK